MAHGQHSGQHAHAQAEHHVVPLRVYVTIFVSLLVLMFLTIAARFVNFGPQFNVLIAMVIAIAKTALIVLYFMHVRYNSRLVQIFAAATFLWLVILFAFTIGDYLARDWPDPARPLGNAPTYVVAQHDAMPR